MEALKSLLYFFSTNLPQAQQTIHQLAAAEIKKPTPSARAIQEYQGVK